LAASLAHAAAGGADEALLARWFGDFSKRRRK